MSKASDQFDPELFRLRPDNLSRSPADATPEAQVPPGAPTRAKRNLRPQRLGVPYVRVPVSWFTTDPRPALADSPRLRLFLLILHLSRFGQRPVVLTEAITRSVGISRKNKPKIVRQLEADRWITVERDGNKALVVRPIVIAG